MRPAADIVSIIGIALSLATAGCGDDPLEASDALAASDTTTAPPPDGAAPLDSAAPEIDGDVGGGDDATSPEVGEVGAQGPAYHREVGAYARERGIGALYALGEACRETVAAFGGGARHFDSPEALARALPAAGTILVKGSRFMRMERVVAALTGAAKEVH